MERRTLYALFALLGLGGLAFLIMRTPEKGDRVGEKPRPMGEIKAASIAALDLTQPGGKDKVTLKRSGDKWQVVSPYDRPADQQAAKSAAEALEKIKWGDVTTQQKDRFAELEISDDKAVHVVAKDGGDKVLADLYIGKSTGNSTMVRVAGKDEVWQAGDFFPTHYKRDGKSWRDHVIFDRKADEAEKVVIRGGGSSVTLERKPPEKDAKDKDGKPGSANIYEAKWKIAESDNKALQPGIELDHSLVNRMVTGLAMLRAGDFLDGAKPEELGLAPSAPGQIEVQVSFKDNKTAGVRIGLLKGEDYHVQATDSGQIFTIKKFTLEAVAHLPQDIRDKSLIALKSDQIDQVTVAQGADVVSLKQGDKGFKADKLADADDNKVKAVVDSFDNLSGTGFVAAGAPELASLVKPKATVTIKPKKGPPSVLKIGDTKGDDVLVQKVGQDPMWLKKFQVDRFLKKPAEMAKDKK